MSYITFETELCNTEILLRVQQLQWRADTGWVGGDAPHVNAHWVLALGSGAQLRSGELCAPLFSRYPRALFTGCSTAGEILGRRIHDGTLVVTAVEFERTRVRQSRVLVRRPADSRAAGVTLARELRSDDLTHVLILADGLLVNGSALVEGLRAELPPSVTITGGLAGDGERMAETYVCAGGHPEQGVIAAVGFYGRALRVGCGSFGGWDSFGPDRLVTRAEGSLLLELDGEPALRLYRRYLGDQAAELPAAALRFPLAVRAPGSPRFLVRTTLGIDEERAGLRFAGDIPEGGLARLMRANLDRLVDGAFQAARAAQPSKVAPELALLVSCVGRRMILRQRVEEELESVGEVLGPTPTAGFYSYGELAPGPGSGLEFHNQTMTVTTLREVDT